MKEKEAEEWREEFPYPWREDDLVTRRDTLRFLVGGTGALFLAPALLILLVWVVYPTIYTIVRSFFGPTGYLGSWVGIDNYKSLFTTPTLTTAITIGSVTISSPGAWTRSGSSTSAVLTGTLAASGDLELHKNVSLSSGGNLTNSGAL